MDLQLVLTAAAAVLVGLVFGAMLGAMLTDHERASWQAEAERAYAEAERWRRKHQEWCKDVLPTWE